MDELMLNRRGRIVICIDARNSSLKLHKTYKVEAINHIGHEVLVSEEGIFHIARFYVPHFLTGDNVVCIEENHGIKNGESYIVESAEESRDPPDGKGPPCVESQMLKLHTIDDKYFNYRFLPKDIFIVSAAASLLNQVPLGRQLPFAASDSSKTVCPECKGTGVYVGFAKTEPCSVCKSK